MKKITSKKRQQIKRQNEQARKRGNQKYSQRKALDMVENQRLKVHLDEEGCNIPIMHKFLNIIGNGTLKEIAKKNPTFATIIMLVIVVIFWDLTKDLFELIGNAGLVPTGLLALYSIRK